MRASPPREIVKWIVEVWDSLNRELIIRSFRNCTLIVASDGQYIDLARAKSVNL